MRPSVTLHLEVSTFLREKNPSLILAATIGNPSYFLYFTLISLKAYLLTVPNLVSIQSVCKYTQLDEGKYDLGHICPTDKRLILTWGFTFIIFIEGYTPYEKDYIFM